MPRRTRNIETYELAVLDAVEEVAREELDRCSNYFHEHEEDE